MADIEQNNARGRLKSLEASNKALLALTQAQARSKQILKARLKQQGDELQTAKSMLADQSIAMLNAEEARNFVNRAGRKRSRAIVFKLQPPKFDGQQQQQQQEEQKQKRQRQEKQEEQKRQQQEERKQQQQDQRQQEEQQPQQQPEAAAAGAAAPRRAVAACKKKLPTTVRIQIRHSNSGFKFGFKFWSAVHVPGEGGG
jgi:hypothetical protein